MDCSPVNQPWYQPAQHAPVYVDCGQTTTVIWAIPEPTGPIIINTLLHIPAGVQC